MELAPAAGVRGRYLEVREVRRPAADRRDRQEARRCLTRARRARLRESAAESAAVDVISFTARPKQPRSRSSTPSQPTVVDMLGARVRFGTIALSERRWRNDAHLSCMRRNKRDRGDGGVRVGARWRRCRHRSGSAGHGMRGRDSLRRSHGALRGSAAPVRGIRATDSLPRSHGALRGSPAPRGERHNGSAPATRDRALDVQPRRPSGALRKRGRSNSR